VNDRTIVKPRPGRRSAQGNDAANNSVKDRRLKKTVANEDKTLMFHPTRRINDVIEPLLKLSDNPLVDYAGELLSLGCQLMSADSHNDVKSLRTECVRLIKNYENELYQSHVNPSLIRSAGFCLCCFMDEAVLNTDWGGSSDWSSQSLLSSFHKQTFGGEVFYTLLDKSIQYSASQHQLVELMYLCLTLGFQGKMRIEEHGDRKLERYRGNAYLAIKDEKSPVPTELSPGWKKKLEKGEKLRTKISLLNIIISFAALLLFIYLVFNHYIDEYVAPVSNQLRVLVSWKSQYKNVGDKSISTYSTLREALQPEIKKGLVTVTLMKSRIRISIASGRLFPSGTAKPNAGFEIVLFKIARLLENTKGNILITGHTDNRRILTAKYPSNQYLSLARATAVANLLASSAKLNGRLWPEARGDTEPLVPNDTKKHRAENRRIEINLLL